MASGWGGAVGAGGVEAAEASLGGAVTGMTPRTAVCTNVTTGQAVTFQHLRGATEASCVAAGLVVEPGHLVQIRVRGVAE
jgi:hypothetical protein